MEKEWFNPLLALADLISPSSSSPGQHRIVITHLILTYPPSDNYPIIAHLPGTSFKGVTCGLAVTKSISFAEVEPLVLSRGVKNRIEKAFKSDLFLYLKTILYILYEQGLEFCLFE